MAEEDSNAWHANGNNFPAEASVASPVDQREWMKMWFAVRQRGRVVRGATPWSQWPPVGFQWFDGTAAAYTVDGDGFPDTVTVLDTAGDAPGWPDLYWNSTLGLPYRPNQFDILFDSDVPQGCYRAQISNVSAPPSNVLLINPGTGNTNPALWNGRVSIIRRNALWWHDRWPRWPGKDGDPKGATLRWYQGMAGTDQYYSKDSVTGVVGHVGSPDATASYSAPVGPEGACVPIVVHAFDEDVYSGNPEDNECFPDRYLAPDFYTALRGLQAAVLGNLMSGGVATGLVSGFVRDRGPGGYDGWDKYAIPAMTPAEALLAAGVNAWSGTTGTPTVDGKLPVPGPSGVTLPRDWGTIGPSNPRPVYFQIVSTGEPEEYRRTTSGSVLAAGVATFDGTYLYGADADFTAGYLTESGSGYVFEGQDIYLSFGPTRTVKRQVRTIYPKEVWIPDVEQEEETFAWTTYDPPDEDHPGEWVVRPASDRYLKYDKGYAYDDADAVFVEGDRARYKGDTYADANVRPWPTDTPIPYDPLDLDPDPRIPYWARFCTFWRTRPKSYTPQKAPRVVASGEIYSVDSGSFVDKDQAWDTNTERQIWKGRDLVLIDPDGGRHAGFYCTGSVNTTVVDEETGEETTGTTFTFAYDGEEETPAAPAEGWRYEVREWQPGAVLDWNGTRWVAAVREGDPEKVDRQGYDPDEEVRFGFVEREDVAIHSKVREEMRKVIDTMIVTKTGASWVANLPGDYNWNNKGGAIPFSYDFTWEGLKENISDWWAIADGVPPDPPPQDEPGIFYGHAVVDGAAPYANSNSALGEDAGNDDASGGWGRTNAYAVLANIPTLFPTTREFLNFATVDDTDTDLGDHWSPPQTSEPPDSSSRDPDDWDYTWGAGATTSTYVRLKTTVEFDANGLDADFRVWTQWYSAGPSTASTQYSSLLGAAGLPMPADPSDPDYDKVLDDDPQDLPAEAYWITKTQGFKGVQIANQVVLLRWQFTYVSEGFAG